MKQRKRFGCIIFGFFLAVLERTAALDCYTCTNASHVSDCKSKTTCKGGESCKNVIASNSTTVDSGSLIGRSAVSGDCSECCKEQHCNKKLCQHEFSEKNCADSTEIHCETVGAMVDMCSDTDKANTVCRRFCGLCDYVNGQWSSWFSWSKCGVTCGKGTETRTRNCSEPAPSGGGHTCMGHSQETQQCTKEPCPIHGSWAGWTPWGGCSVSCGIGLQRRDRSCSNPYPTRFGDHCFGDARDDKICPLHACEDGGWADWSTWDTCSKTCGDGIHTRSRNCDNPLPSVLGKYCPGNSYHIEPCRLEDCSETNGGWSTWSDWTHCSATCNIGMRSRLRDCINPEPSSGGTYCQGSPYEVQQCIVKSCPRKLSAFSAKNPSDGYCKILPISWLKLVSFCYISFNNVPINEGNRYNHGNFTCLYPGLYYFEAYLLAKSNGNNHIECVIRKNSYSVIDFYQENPVNTSNGTLSATGSATVHLVKGDIVNLRCTHRSSELHDFSSFSGFLVSADV